MKKIKEKYEEAVDQSKENTKTMLRWSKLSVIGTCMALSSLPLTYMSMYEDYIDSLSNKIKTKADEDTDNE